MEEILKLIKQYDGEIYNLCYKLLKENEHHMQVFQYVCENLLERPDNPSIKIEEYNIKLYKHQKDKIPWKEEI